MSKAFFPPDTLSKENQLIIADVRRKIWTNGLIGLGTGLTFGYVINTIVMVGTKNKLWHIPQATPTTGFAATMICGALFSYGNAIVTGKNEVHTMHHIFKLASQSNNSQHDDIETQYDIALQQAIHREQSGQQQQQPGDQSSTTTKDTNINTNDNERIQRQLNRLQRKGTLKTRIMTPNGGLSDSHGGTWSSSSSSSSTTTTTSTDKNIVVDDTTQFTKG